ncbi:hypothetical protein CS8_096380 [Cupriavidus sp. 8B]
MISYLYGGDSETISEEKAKALAGKLCPDQDAPFDRLLPQLIATANGHHFPPSAGRKFERASTATSTRTIST